MASLLRTQRRPRSAQTLASDTSGSGCSHAAGDPTLLPQSTIPIYGVVVLASRRLAFATSLLAAGLVGVMAPSASADTQTITDAAGDVVKTVYQTPRGETTTTTPAEFITDIVKADFDYRQQFLIAVVQLRDIEGRGRRADPSVRVKGGGSDLTFTRYVGRRLTATEPRTAGTRCEGGRVTVNPEANTVRFKIPARCFGAPAKVRLGAAAGRIAVDDDFTYYLDDARDDRARGGYFEFTTRLGAPVRRG